MVATGVKRLKLKQKRQRGHIYTHDKVHAIIPVATEQKKGSRIYNKTNVLKYILICALIGVLLYFVFRPTKTDIGAGSGVVIPPGGNLQWLWGMGAIVVVALLFASQRITTGDGKPKGKEIQMSGDGNCFFRAIAYHQLGDQENFQEIKTQLLEEYTKIDKNEENLSLAMKDQLDTYEEQAKLGMSKGNLPMNWKEIGQVLTKRGAWGGGMLTQFVADFYKVKINVKNASWGSNAPGLEFFPNDANGVVRTEKMWTLLHKNGNHYNVLEHGGG